jgi:hypothetical protein
MNDHVFGWYQLNRAARVPMIQSAFRRRMRTMVLGPDGALRIALVTDSLSAIGADFVVADMAAVKTEQDIWRVLASLNGTGHPGYCGAEGWDALWALDARSRQRPVGLVIGNLDGNCGAAAEAYLIGNVQIAIERLQYLRVFFTVSDPGFVVRSVADGHGCFCGRMVLYDWSGF